jgi:glycosyltransferase involved in cell wall biosynthesis
MIASPFKRFCQQTVDKADMLLPNSAEELDELAKFIGLQSGGLTQKAHLVVNATDFPEYSPTDVCTEYAIPENFVLQVGRIEYTKGQLNVVKALLKLPEIPIVFIGWVNNKPYADKLQKLANKRGNVFFLNEVPHDKIYSFYRKAALHILPSLRESPGLVSLEALSQGCKIVTADSRFTPSNTYFKDFSTIINPFSVQSIKKGILQEIRTQRNMVEIGNSVRNRFTWANAAAATYEGYKKML